MEEEGFFEREGGRIVALVLFLLSFSVLLLSIYLEPSSHGHGTHMQLGLGECTFLKETGHPCPMCGMTTAFALLSHLHFFDALLAQPFGVILYMVNLLILTLSLMSLVGRKEPSKIWQWILDQEPRISILLVVGLLLGWAYKLIVF